jgi:SWI/SNF-related matrix-associated actin-dependent regulator 1 of chromatin subfamily A
MDAMGFTYLRLDGQTDIQTRQQLIDQFTNDTSIPVFLLSTRAGGMGINLTAADTCILHDLDFNPFNDIQAEDRVHRIGQHKLVTVIKMVTEDTVDADIYKMQERKAEMNAAILETKTSGAKQKKEESKEMNSMLKNAVTRYQMS